MLHGRRAVHVGSHKYGAPPHLLQFSGEFGGRGGFARTLQAHQKKRCRRLPIQVKRRVLRAHEGCQFVANNLHHLLAGRQAAHDFLADTLLAHALHEVFDDLEIDVRFQKRQPDFARCLLDVGFRQLAAAAQAREYSVQFCRQGFKHGASRGLQTRVRYSSEAKLLCFPALRSSSVAP